MGLRNITALAIAVAAVGTMAASPVLARPHHRPNHRQQKVCKTEWRHHQRVRVCHWR